MKQAKLILARNAAMGATKPEMSSSRQQSPGSNSARPSTDSLAELEIALEHAGAQPGNPVDYTAQRCGLLPPPLLLLLLMLLLLPLLLPLLC